MKIRAVLKCHVKPGRNKILAIFRPWKKSRLFLARIFTVAKTFSFPPVCLQYLDVTSWNRIADEKNCPLTFVVDNQLTEYQQQMSVPLCQPSLHFGHEHTMRCCQDQQQVYLPPALTSQYHEWHPNGFAFHVYWNPDQGTSESLHLPHPGLRSSPCDQHSQLPPTVPRISSPSCAPPLPTRRTYRRSRR